MDEQYVQCVEKVLESVGKYTCEGSGWVENGIVSVEVTLVEYRPLAGSSYIKTPKKLSNSKKGIVNVKNPSDEKCFLWSILAGLHPFARHSYRLSHYREYENDLNMVGIDYPVTIRHIKKFEKQNVNISVNMFSYESEVMANGRKKDEIYPVRITEHKGDVYKRQVMKSV